MDYTKLPLHNDNCNEKTKESSPVSSASPVRPMYSISSFSPDTTGISKSFPYSPSRIGTIKLLILTIVTPIMILTIVNPMWICGIKVTQETIDVIVASKDGHRLQEFETTITVIENIPPRTKNHRNRKQISQHDTNKKGFKAHAQVSVASQVKSHNESITDKIRERLFRNRNSCAYVALSVITLCAVTIFGVVCLSSDSKKAYESVNNEEENRLIDDHYVRVEDCDEDEKLGENNVTENKIEDACVIDCTRVQVNDNNISTPTTSPPPYSPNTNSELISTSTTSSENTQQSTV
ncbi:20321_t:CDS:2 [Rhizophagus irregularis]|nr:20321_t:CDS:2 [Rhizophagus irregularis]